MMKRAISILEMAEKQHESNRKELERRKQNQALPKGSELYQEKAHQEIKDALLVLKNFDSKDLFKHMSVRFFYDWYNAKGNNTEQGFDDWWEKSGKPHLELFFNERRKENDISNREKRD
jgi:hypothetical protein